MVGSWGVLAERLGAAGVRPACTPVGVTRLFSPELRVEIEATAVDWAWHPQATSVRVTTRTMALSSC